MTEKPTVLVVDGDEIAQMLLSDVIDVCGCRAMLTATAREALDAIGSARFAVALIDLDLPDGAGFSLIREARKRDPHLEIIVLASGGSLDTAVDAFEIGAFDYITKPFEALEGISGRVRRAVERWRRGEELRELIGMGSMSSEPEPTAGDEMDHLARSFKAMARALKESREQLVQSERMAAFGQLGAGMTHEIKNPMTGIVAFSQVGQTSVDDPKKCLELFQMIEKQALRCKEILVNFLKFARQTEREHTLLELNQVVQEAAQIFSHQLGMSGVRVALELGDDVPAVMANAGELQQVLLNLAMNAQQAMDDGGKLVLTTERGADGAALIEVADNGSGMPEDVRRRIFEPFFTTKEAGEGTGLGLAVSFAIIGDHNGTITVDSELGKGTTFRIQIPAQKTEL